MQNQDCPLCGALAATSDDCTGQKKEYNCPNCTEFIVTNGAEARLKDSMQSWKDKIAAKAKATPKDKILFIFIPDPHPPAAPNSKVLSARQVVRDCQKQPDEELSPPTQ